MMLFIHCRSTFCTHQIDIDQFVILLHWEFIIMAVSMPSAFSAMLSHRILIVVDVTGKLGWIRVVIESSLWNGTQYRPCVLCYQAPSEVYFCAPSLCWYIGCLWLMINVEGQWTVERLSCWATYYTFGVFVTSGRWKWPGQGKLEEMKEDLTFAFYQLLKSRGVAFIAAGLVFPACKQFSVFSLQFSWVVVLYSVFSLQ